MGCGSGESGIRRRDLIAIRLREDQYSSELWFVWTLEDLNRR